MIAKTAKSLYLFVLMAGALVLLGGCVAPSVGVTPLQTNETLEERHVSHKHYTINQEYAAHIGQSIVRVREYFYRLKPEAQTRSVRMRGLREGPRIIYPVRFDQDFTVRIPSGTTSQNSGGLSVPGQSDTQEPRQRYTDYHYSSDSQHAIVGKIPRAIGEQREYFLLYLERPFTKDIFGTMAPAEMIPAHRSRLPGLLVDTRTLMIEEHFIWRNGRIVKLDQPIVLEGIGRKGGDRPGYTISENIGAKAELDRSKPYANYELVYNGRDQESFFVTYREYAFSTAVGTNTSLGTDSLVPSHYLNLVFGAGNKTVRYKDMVIDAVSVSNERIVYRVTHDAVDLRH